LKSQVFPLNQLFQFHLELPLVLLHLCYLSRPLIPRALLVQHFPQHQKLQLHRLVQEFLCLNLLVLLHR
jgi:hypothetical protein